jgi:uncharacterized protein (DUF305 family)
MGNSDAWLNWRSALVLGLISSTFSTIISQLMAARIGRDAAVDWMVVASIPLRDAALQIEPSAGVVVAGILFHQWADISWAVVFFGLLGRWTAGLNPWTILLVAPLWALLTSASEWLFLVPLVPFWQPIFTLDQPYWIGFWVHLTSASMYPLFPYLRDWMANSRRSRHRRFALAWSGLATGGAAALGVVAFLGWHKHELPHMGGNAAYDQGYMQRMAAHHAQGVELAEMAAEQASDPHLRAIARMMAAAQRGEIAIFDQWWQSWFGGPLPSSTLHDHLGMPGIIPEDQLHALRETGQESFDPLFVELMTVHHSGAIAMADEAMTEAGDLRLKLMSHAIRHQQLGQIELMHGSEGIRAVRAALAATFGSRTAPGTERTAFEAH